VTVFVPPDEPAGSITWSCATARAAPELRVAPTSRMVLAGAARVRGPVKIRRDEGLGAFYSRTRRTPTDARRSFANDRTRQRWLETSRWPVLRGPRPRPSPTLVASGEPFAGPSPRRPVAPCSRSSKCRRAGERSVDVVMGQADDPARADGRPPQAPRPRGRGRSPLDETRGWVVEPDWTPSRSGRRARSSTATSTG
jgi:hypothetical protein